MKKDRCGMNDFLKFERYFISEEIFLSRRFVFGRREMSFRRLAVQPDIFMESWSVMNFKSKSGEIEFR